MKTIGDKASEYVMKLNYELVDESKGVDGLVNYPYICGALLTELTELLTAVAYLEAMLEKDEKRAHECSKDEDLSDEDKAWERGGEATCRAYLDDICKRFERWASVFEY
jgi:hypothetical protein